MNIYYVRSRFFIAHLKHLVLLLLVGLEDSYNLWERSFITPEVLPQSNLCNIGKSGRGSIFHL